MKTRGQETILKLPKFCLVTLIGVTGSGKTTFARKHFHPLEILTSDSFGAVISNDENSMEASQDAFEVLHLILQKRLSRNLLTVIDATSIQSFARRKILDIAGEIGAPTVAIILNVPEKTCIERTLQRTDRPFGAKVVREHFEFLRQTLTSIYTEGFDLVYILEGVEIISNTRLDFVDEPIEHQGDVRRELRGDIKEIDTRY